MNVQKFKTFNVLFSCITTALFLEGRQLRGDKGSNETCQQQERMTKQWEGLDEEGEMVSEILFCKDTES
jgi:hypothetical protein